MSREVPAPEGNDRPDDSISQQKAKAAAESLVPTLAEANVSKSDSTAEADLSEQSSQLQPKAKVALIRKLIAQLETDQIQTILEFGLREIGDRHRRKAASSVDQNTRLLLKKDYSYQDRGLTEPTQYYVYLRRRKPKLDRYIGALFYIPQGCTLSYFMDAEGRIVFNPPHNVFQMQDAKNRAVTQIVRLVCLQPPPPEYTFTKQQSDTPDIHLHLEYLDPQTQQSITQQAYPFPACMYEGGVLDRYRWEVCAITKEELLPAALSAEPAMLHQSSELSVEEPFPAAKAASSFVSQPATYPLLDCGLSVSADDAAQSPPNAELSSNRCEGVSAPPARRVLELPTKALTFYLVDRHDLDVVIKRLRLWAAWSEKAMPQSRWEVVQDGDTYTLINAHFKRRILKLSVANAAIVLENSLPVVMRWFHDLGLAVSQTQNRKQYSAAQLKLAHSLFVDMSLSQTDPIVVLKQLFGVDFSKSLLNKT